MIATGMHRTRIGLTAAALLAAGWARGGLPASAATEGEEAKATPEAVAFFETRIRPVLSENCLSCHGARKQTSGLRLDSREAILEGGLIQGPAVYLDDPAGSPLIQAVKHEIEPPMPLRSAPGRRDRPCPVRSGTHRLASRC